MKRVLSAILAAGLAVGSAPALAQRSGSSRMSGAPTSRESGSPAATSRQTPMYTQPPGRTGTVGWNTPNQDGNLGGPGAGGGSGSP